MLPCCPFLVEVCLELELGDDVKLKEIGETASHEVSEVTHYVQGHEEPKFMNFIWLKGGYHSEI